MTSAGRDLRSPAGSNSHMGSVQWVLGCSLRWAFRAGFAQSSSAARGEVNAGCARGRPSL